MTENLCGSGAPIRLTTDLDLRIIDADQPIYQIADALSQSTDGIALHQALPFFDVHEVEQVRKACLANPFHSQRLDVCYGVDGHCRHFTWMACVLTNQHGEPERLQWVGVESTNNRRQMEASLFQQAVLARISDAVITLSPHLTITSFNSRAETLFGLRASRAAGCKMSDFFVISPADESREGVMNALQQQGCWAGVVQFQKVAGDLLYTHTHITVVTTSQGHKLGYVAVCHDITEKYHLEQKHQSQATIRTLLQEIMDQTGALAWATDAQGRKRYMNATYRQVFNIDEREDNKQLAEIFSGPELERIVDHNEQVLQHGAILDIVEEMPLPQNRKVKYRSLKFPVHTAEGVFAAGFALDITRELHREAELANLRSRFEKAAKIAADVISDWDIEHDRLWRSDPESNIDVHPTSAASMKDRYQRLHPDDLPRFRETLDAALSSDAEIWTCEYRYKSGAVEGRYKILSEKAVIMRNEEGRAVRMISVVRDITEKKRLQQELRDKEKAVIAASIEGQEAERNELARELHDNVGQVLAMCKLFVDIASDSIQHEYLDKCRHHLQRAIGEIRSLSHRLSPDNLIRKGLVAALAEMTDNLNQTGKLLVNSQLSPEMETVVLSQSCQTTAYRIIQECISNILKHAQATTALLRIGTSKGHLWFEVSDDGVGFDPATVARGIGLKNIYNRVELSGGSVSIETAPALGCLVRVHLPLS